MSETVWQAQWIWCSPSREEPNTYAEARTAFTLEPGLISAQLRISANQEYRLFINGKPIGSGPSPSDCQWKSYDTYEVAGALNSGEVNSIAVLAYNFGTADIVTGQRQGPGGLIVQLDIGYPDRMRCVHTDADWRCRRSPRWVRKVSRMHNWGGFKEIYLAGEEDGWEEPDYDDASWERARVVAAAEDPASPWPRLLPREIPFLARSVVLPSSVLRTEDNYGSIRGAEELLRPDGGGMVVDAACSGSLPGAVFDFAAVKTGYPSIVLNAPGGGVLKLSYGESLELAHLDTFILKKGVNRLSPFGRRAFRYVKLSVMAAPLPLHVESFSLEAVHYPFTQEGSFRCSASLLDRIWETGRYTTLVNSQEHLEDCPYREQALWVVDAVVMAKVIYSAFGDTALVRKCLLQGARIQNADGSIPATGPERNAFLLPDFNAYWLLGVYDYWRYSGDAGFLREAEGNIRRLTAWFRDQEDENGLFAGADREGWWCFVDWADYIDKRDRVTAVSCLYYKLLSCVSRMAEEGFGDLSYARECRERAERLRGSIRRLLRPGGDGFFADCLTEEGLSASRTAQTNFLAIWTGLMEDAEADRFIREEFAGGRCPPLKGAFFYHIVLEVLWSRGYGEMALELVCGYWGEMLARGATTWWETFDPSTPSCTVPSPYQGNTPTYLSDWIPVSHCHGWGASPTYLLTKHVLGVDISALASGRFGFLPALGSLSWAEGRVPTPFGFIEARLSREADGSVLVRLEYPSALKLQSGIPVLPEAEEHRNGRILLQGKAVMG